MITSLHGNNILRWTWSDIIKIAKKMADHYYSLHVRELANIIDGSILLKTF